MAVFVDDIIVGFDKLARDAYLYIKQEYGKLIKISSSEINEVRKFTGVQITREIEAS